MPAQPKETLEKILASLGFQTTVEEHKLEEGVLLDVKTDDAGRLIGRQGQTLSDLQYITNRLLFQQDATAPKIMVDVGGYRAQAREALVKKAKDAAEKVRRWGDTVELEPMTAFDRRVVHQALKDDPDVKPTVLRVTARTKKPSCSGQDTDNSLVAVTPRRRKVNAPPSAHFIGRPRLEFFQRAARAPPLPPATGRRSHRPADFGFRVSISPLFKKRARTHCPRPRSFWDSCNSSLRLLLVNDVQLINRRNSAAGLGCGAEVVVFVIELEAIVDGVGSQRHRHEAFPTILHQRHGMQRLRFAVGDDVRLNGFPTQRLLLGIKSDFNRVKVVCIARLLQRRQAREHPGATGQQQHR